MNRTDKITEIKQRIMFPTRAYMYSDLMTFHYLLETNEDAGKKHEPLDLLKFYPIVIVTCFETFFKMALAECIDHDQKYLDHAKKLADRNRIDLDIDVFIAIRDRRFSIGDLFAQSLKYGNPEEIFSNCTQITGEVFLTNLKKIQPTEIYKDKPDEDLEDFIENFGGHLQNITQAFKLRHIYCHEYMAGVFANEEETIGMLDSGYKFLKASDKYFRDLLYGEEALKEGLSDFTIITDHYMRFKELDKTLMELKQKFPKNANQLDLNFANWKKYKEEEHRLFAELQGTVGVQPSFIPRLTIDDVEDKIRELKKLLTTQ